MKKSLSKIKGKELYKPSHLLIKTIKESKKEFKAEKLKFYNEINAIIKALNS